MADVMSDGLGRRVDEYIQTLFSPHDEVLDEALRELERAGLPPINVSANEGKLLNILASLSGAKTMVEVGTLAGYSAIWLGRALPADGKLITLELDPKHADVATRNLERAGLSDKVEVRVGPAVQSLQKMVATGEGPFDLFFIDADKEGYPAYLELALQLSHPGTLILADNVIRNGQVTNPDSLDERLLAIQKYNRAVAEHPRLKSIILPIIRDNMDGLAISIVQ
jgi:predicted O-methyltransferase YrrM